MSATLGDTNCSGSFGRGCIIGCKLLTLASVKRSICRSLLLNSSAKFTAPVRGHPRVWVYWCLPPPCLPPPVAGWGGHAAFSPAGTVLLSPPASDAEGERRKAVTFLPVLRIVSVTARARGGITVRRKPEPRRRMRGRAAQAVRKGKGRGAGQGKKDGAVVLVRGVLEGDSGLEGALHDTGERWGTAFCVWISAGVNTSAFCSPQSKSVRILSSSWWEASTCNAFSPSVPGGTCTYVSEIWVLRSTCRFVRATVW